jgi:sec-independent protein translocase protein TatA
MIQQTLAIGMPGPFEMIIIAGLALLVFGKRLPSVGRDLAMGIRGFQQGLKSTGKEDEEPQAVAAAAAETKSLPDKR